MPRSIARLKPLSDFFVCISNDNNIPEIVGPAGVTWDDARARFVRPDTPVATPQHSTTAAAAPLAPTGSVKSTDWDCGGEA